MPAAVVTYDLLNVSPQDNKNVRDALINEGMRLSVEYPPGIVRTLPDTTAIIDNTQSSPGEIIQQVRMTIILAGATPGKIFAATISDYAVSLDGKSAIMALLHIFDNQKS